MPAISATSPARRAWLVTVSVAGFSALVVGVLALASATRGGFLPKLGGRLKVGGAATLMVGGTAFAAVALTILLPEETIRDLIREERAQRALLRQEARSNQNPVVTFRKGGTPQSGPFPPPSNEVYL